MTLFSVHIISQRLLFRKTFTKLLCVLDTDVVCLEHPTMPVTAEALTQSGQGAVIVDCAACDADQIIECLLQLLTLDAKAILVVVLDEQNDAAVDAAMNLGATGVIIKASPPQVIVSALQRILTGERCRPAPAVKIPYDSIPEDMRRQLSAREQKMLRAIMGGQSISATATQLHITPAKLVSEMRGVMATIRGRAF